MAELGTITVELADTEGFIERFATLCAAGAVAINDFEDIKECTTLARARQLCDAAIRRLNEIEDLPDAETIRSADS